MVLANIVGWFYFVFVYVFGTHPTMLRVWETESVTVKASSLLTILNKLIHDKTCTKIIILVPGKSLCI